MRHIALLLAVTLTVVVATMGPKSGSGRVDGEIAPAPTNGVQFMIKDSKKHASTRGWGFGQFNDGKPVSEAVIKTCFPSPTPPNAATLSSPTTHLDGFQTSTLIRK